MVNDRGNKMRDQHDSRTAELLPVPPKRGRPATGTAMSGAERMRLQRARDAARRNDALRMLCAAMAADDSAFAAGHCYGVAAGLAAAGVITYEHAGRAYEWFRARHGLSPD
jgi:hypothetical protein